MLVGVVEPGPKVLYRENEIGFGGTAEAILDRLAHEVRQGLEAHPQATSVGVGIPCTIDFERGFAVSSVHLPIVGVPVRELLQERLEMPVLIDNDANLAALAEHRFGAGRGTRDVVMLTIGTGIGGGLVLEDEVYRGTTGAAGELGHTVVDAEGPPCFGNCPNRGCVEAMVSGTALARDGLVAAQNHPGSALGRRLDAGEPIDGRAVTEAALAGDEAARAVVERAGRYLGVALTSFANIFEPDVIIVGGGVMAAGELLLGPAREELRSKALEPQNATRVELAELGPDAGMIGAATMAAGASVAA